MAKTTKQSLESNDMLTELSVGGVVSRIYHGPSKERAPLIVYCHGGLFNSGDLKIADTIAAELATVATVVSVNYPLAPANPFPAAPNATFAVLVDAAKNAATLNADSKRVYVAGDEAGGNIAAAIAMMSRDRGGPKLAGQILITPLLDPCLTTESMRKAAGCPCQQAWTDYLPNAVDRIHPYAAPLQSLRLAKLPPALIVSGEMDPTRDEAEQYAAKLIAAGVPVQAQRLAGATHGLARADHPAFFDTVAAIKRFVSEPPLATQR